MVASGMEALERLRKVDPLLYLSPSPEISVDAHASTQYLFSSLVPEEAPLTGEGFDAEQIWSHIDPLSCSILFLIRRELKWLVRKPVSGPAPEALYVDEAELKTGGVEEEELEKGDGEDENEDWEEEEEEEDDDGEEDEAMGEKERME